VCFGSTSVNNSTVRRIPDKERIFIIDMLNAKNKFQLTAQPLALSGRKKSDEREMKWKVRFSSSLFAIAYTPVDSSLERLADEKQKPPDS